MLGFINKLDLKILLVYDSRRDEGTIWSGFATADSLRRKLRCAGRCRITTREHMAPQNGSGGENILTYSVVLIRGELLPNKIISSVILQLVKDSSWYMYRYFGCGVIIPPNSNLSTARMKNIFRCFEGIDIKVK